MHTETNVLSDLYQVQEEEPMLELQVLMLNINDGNNEDLKESCQVLKEYMQYVNKVRENIYQNNMNLNDAVEYAVTKCIKEGILEEFLKENRAEVVPMSIFEFDEEREWRMIREIEYQYGVEDGRVLGLAEGKIAGLAEGENLLGTLIAKLCSAGGISDVELAAKDEEARKRFYKEFGMID